MPDPASLVMSSASLLLSGTTAWLTLLRRGAVRMTQPTMVFLGPDGGAGKPSKVFFRALLYATSYRGCIVENMFVRVRVGEIAQNFTFWVYGNDKLSRGGGLFVGREGVACNHHFTVPAGVDFNFFAETYRVEMYASLLGRRSPVRLQSLRLTLSKEQSQRMREPGVGAMFNWGPDTNTYHAHLEVPDKTSVLELRLPSR